MPNPPTGDGEGRQRPVTFAPAVTVAFVVNAAAHQFRHRSKEGVAAWKHMEW